MAATLIAPFQTLSLLEAGFGDYTNKAVLRFTDVNALGAVTTPQSFNLSKVTAGTIVQNFCIYVQTPFVFSNASILVTTLSAGDGASVTTFLGASNIAGAGQTTPVLQGAVYASTTQFAYAVGTNGQLVVSMAITAAQNYNTATAGEVHIFWQQRQMSELVYPQQ